MRLSVIVPCFNEERGLGRLYDALNAALPAVAQECEILFVDDGSQDGSLAEMRRLAALDDRVRYIALSRNFGKEAAMLAGLHQACGDAVAIMDADLQHPPEMLAKMVGMLEAGYDQVVARRTRAGDSRTRSAVSRVYYWMMNKLSEVQLQDGAGDFRVMTRRAVDSLLSLGEYNRFSKGLFAWIGFDTATINYANVCREDGPSKWSFAKLLNYGIDGVISFNNKPLRAAIYLGALVTLLAFGYAIFITVQGVVGEVGVPGYTTMMVGIAGMGGLQLLFLGILGEYLGRIYYESKRRPHFIVKDTSDTSSGVGVRGRDADNPSVSVIA